MCNKPFCVHQVPNKLCKEYGFILKIVYAILTHLYNMTFGMFGRFSSYDDLLSLVYAYESVIIFCR